MKKSIAQTSMELTEQRLINKEFDFQGSYMAVKSLDSDIISSPCSVTKRTVKAIASIIKSDKFESQRQSFFLYREASEALIKILESPVKDKSFASMVIPLMEKVLLQSINDRHRAVAEVLGSLPLGIKGPCYETDSSFSEITFQKLIERLGINDLKTMHWQGRSLIGRARFNSMGVIKFVKKNENPFKITMEPWWMAFLKIDSLSNNVKFDIPEPVQKNETYLFKIKNPPKAILNKNTLHPHYFAIAYTAPPEYFSYPNGKTFQYKNIIGQELKEIFSRNAWLLGRMTSMGIVHTALIPLFHNRVQQDRREDGGIYQWERGGRLDQWLESCRYPNFASSGLRDFEHIISIENSKQLHHYIGAHLLSLILVLGSCFRNINPEAKGLDRSGKPVDTRYLFDHNIFHEITSEVVTKYYEGFTGSTIRNDYFFLPDDLINSLIDEMGVDNHMEEILRVHDQNRMDMDEFTDFLLKRGMNMDEISSFKKGRQDISILTGPHLGGFSQRISVPRLIDFIFTCAALCISGKYIVENDLKKYKN